MKLLDELNNSRKENTALEVKHDLLLSEQSGPKKRKFDQSFSLPSLPQIDLGPVEVNVPSVREFKKTKTEGCHCCQFRNLPVQ